MWRFSAGLQAKHRARTDLTRGQDVCKLRPISVDCGQSSRLLTTSGHRLPTPPERRPVPWLNASYEGPSKHARDSGIRGIAMLRTSVVEAPEFVPNQQHWRGHLPRPMLLQVVRGSVLIPWLNTADFGT